MIALRHALPLIRCNRGYAVAFESLWLRLAIEDAAGRAGYHRWCLVDDLVAGISLYLRKCYVKTVIDVPELESVVRLALRGVGYNEVAARFRAIVPTRRISLVRCLKNDSSVQPATFFERLAETIARLYENEVRHFHFYDLRSCVEQLENNEGAGQVLPAAGLRERIISFVWEHVCSHDWNQQVWYSIS